MLEIENTFDQSENGPMPAPVAVVGLRDATKIFGATKALKSASFELRSGEVMALLGENGAGKSTCVKIIAGVYQPTSGSMTLDGKPVSFATPLDAQRAGIAVMHQHPGLFPDLSLAENDSTKAIAYFDKALGNNEKNLTVLFLKTKALESLSKFEEADKTYQKMLQLFPENTFINKTYAQFLMKTNRVDEAELQLRAIASSPSTGTTTR